MKKISMILLVVIVFVGLLLPAFNATPVSAASGNPFSDVPADSWATDAIELALEKGLMQGMGDGTFGYGRQITRAQFVALLSNMFGWSTIRPQTQSFADVAANRWYYEYVETAASLGIVSSQGRFYPNAPILRQDMAVMLVRALGYSQLARQLAVTDHVPFTDINNYKGYIIFAYDTGIIGGVGSGRFAPYSTATREQAAAIITRVYNRLNATLDWLHGFYAFASFGQRGLIRDMNAVSFGWSVMEWDAENGARLNTSPEGGNPWHIPAGYELIADFPYENNVRAHLNVFMETAMGLHHMLADATARSAAVDAILFEATRIYDAIGRSPYDGVTINFEGLRGESSKADFNTLIEELAIKLHINNLSLYVTVHPPTIDGQYFDGYDFRRIGELADRVILMVHDYHPRSLEGFIGTQWQRNAAITPIAEVYRALKAITDPITGVQDRSKILIGLSFHNIGWFVDENNRVISPLPVAPSMETVYRRMNQADTYFGWSDLFRNPYIIYTTESGERVFLWYEDSRSILEKLLLARLFGVTGASVWRLGIIPNEYGWDVWREFL